MKNEIINTENYLKEFVPYEQALALKELGFDEECLAIYTHNNSHYEKGSFFLHHPHPFTIEELTPQVQDVRESAVYILAPLFQQAFKFFRDKYQMVLCYEPCLKKDLTYIFFIYIEATGEKVFVVESRYDEEAELECLNKLIEICKNEQ